MDPLLAYLPFFELISAVGFIPYPAVLRLFFGYGFLLRIFIASPHPEQTQPLG